MHFAISDEVAHRASEMVGIKNPYISLSDLRCQCMGNEILQLCLNEMVMYSLRYAETVCRFEQIVSARHGFDTDGVREEIERVRSTIHDSTIDAINILSRAFRSEGKGNKWITKMSGGGRAAYGKFALLIAFEAATELREDYV